MLSAKIKKKSDKQRSEVQVYCGPTLPGIAKQYTSYKDGVPSQLAAKMQAEPVLQNLLVPLNKLPEVMGQLRGKTGPYYSLFTAAVKMRGSDSK